MTMTEAIQMVLVVMSGAINVAMGVRLVRANRRVLKFEETSEAWKMIANAHIEQVSVLASRCRDLNEKLARTGYYDIPGGTTKP